ncbi:hypothetical protein [uncultured Alistipes sp.]|uniref:hypothetical protein n=1 Tax=uncultured Alistipes sp. TaxID=538949 RepID=UPI002729EBC6|nr:hypothetical protein [uncultured Alistipes sp.]
MDTIEGYAMNDMISNMMRGMVDMDVDTDAGATNDTGGVADTGTTDDAGNIAVANAGAGAEGRVDLPEPGTPRYYNTHRTKKPFWRLHKSNEGEPAWVKVGRGLLAVGDGTPQQMIAPGLIFSIEKDEHGANRIGTYGRDDHKDDVGLGRPYALLTMRSTVSDGIYVRRNWISYEDMVMAVRKVFPMAWVPTEEEFYAEYGIKDR